MFQYNQPNSGQQVRIGNWFEELKLQEETGIRYFPPLQDRSGSLMTKARCITHSEQIESKDYKSTTHDSMITPHQCPEYQWSVHTDGPRLKKQQDRLKSVVDEEFRVKELHAKNIANKLDFTTEFKSKFGKPEFEGKGLNKNSDRILKNISLNDAPITIYSDAIQRSNKTAFPTTYVMSESRPFAKSSVFSSGLSETFEVQRNFPNVTDYQTLIAFRKRLVLQIKRARGEYPGQAMRSLVALLWRASDGVFLTLGSLIDTVLDRYNLTMDSSEIKAIIAVFGIDGDRLSKLKLLNFFRREPFGARKDTCEKLLSKISKGSNSNEIDIKKMSDCYCGSNFKDFLDTLREIHSCFNDDESFNTEDVVDYLIDISSEIDDDKEFERAIRNEWVL